MSDFNIMVYKKVQTGSGCLETFMCGPPSLVMSAVDEAATLQLLLPLYSQSLSYK